MCVSVCVCVCAGSLTAAGPPGKLCERQRRAAVQRGEADDAGGADRRTYTVKNESMSFCMPHSVELKFVIFSPHIILF